MGNGNTPAASLFLPLHKHQCYRPPKRGTTMTDSPWKKERLGDQIGASEGMRRLFRILEQVARTDATV